MPSIFAVKGIARKKRKARPTKTTDQPSTPLPRSRLSDVNNKDDARKEALLLWKRDELGSFCLATLTRLDTLKAKRRQNKQILSRGSSSVKSFAYRERSAVKGLPVSQWELDRRQEEDLRRSKVEAKKAERQVKSKAQKKRQLREDDMFGNRKCLAALININNCCGKDCRHATLATSSPRTTFFCADDIFVARSQILDEPSATKWFSKKCQSVGSNSFVFDSMPLCDACFSLLYGIKVMS